MPDCCHFVKLLRSSHFSRLPGEKENETGVESVIWKLPLALVACVDDQRDEGCAKAHDVQRLVQPTLRFRTIESDQHTFATPLARQRSKPDRPVYSSQGVDGLATGKVLPGI